MSTIIQIKRSNGAAAPSVSTLVEGELAYSQDSSNLGANGILYIGAIESGANVIHKLGGKYYTNLLDSATANAIPNTIVKRDNTGFANINVVVSSSANKWTTPRTITLAGDLSGSVSIDGSQDVTLYGNVVNNGVNLGSDTTGDYVANVLPGTGITVTGYSGEIANLTVGLATSGATPGLYGNSSSFPTITVDAYGRITGISNVYLISTYVAEGTNLYFTNSRARTAISVTGAATYDNANGIINVTGGVTSVGGATGAVSNAQLAAAITASGLLTTSNVVELTNLYYSNTRVYGNVNQIGYAYISQVTTKANIVDLTTANVTELNNLYYTNARVYGNVTSLLPNYTGNLSVGNIIGVGGNLTIITGNARSTFTNTGNLTLQGSISAGSFIGSSTNTVIISGAYSTLFDSAGNVYVANALVTNVLVANVIQGATTSNIVEGINLYYTNARVFANVIQLGYATNAYVDARLLTKANVIDLTTANVTELTNLYYTNARVFANVIQLGYATNAYVDARLLTKANVADLTTTNVAEGTNLYFTNARARTALTSANGISYSNSTGLFGLTTTGVTGSTYGGSSNVPVLVVDNFGRITSAANVAVAGVSAFSASGNAFTITTSAGTTFIANIQQDSVRLGVDTTGDYVRNVLAGTSIVVTNQGGEGATPTIATSQNIDTTASPTFFNLTVSGNLNVVGNTTTINSTTLQINDPLIYLAGNNYVSDVVDIGFVGNYYDGNVQRHAGLFRDATDGNFKLFANLNPEPSSVIDTANATFRYANLFVNYVTGNVIGTISSISNFSTTDLAEGTNLYYTNARVFANVLQLGYATNAYVNARDALKANVVDLTTANVAELTNLYYSNTRVYGNVNQIGYAYVSQVITKANIVDLTTANVTETTNLYYSNTRVYGNVNQIGYAYIAQVAAKANIVDLTTSNVVEGTNLYFTNARSRSSLSQGAGISYNASTGVISLDSSSNTFLIGKLFDGNYTGDNVTVNYTLPFNSQGANAILVFVDSILQTPLTDYSTTANILTFTSPPETNAVISYRYFSSQNINLNLANLGDVSSVVSPFPNSTLVYNGTFWVPTATTSIGAVTLVGGATGAISNAQLASAIVSSGLLTTANVTETTNLYYTNARVFANVLQLGYATNAYVDARLLTKANVADLTTSNVAEGTNLYYTNARVYANVINSFVSIATNQTITGTKTFSGGIYSSSNSYNFGSAVADGSIYYVKSSNTYGLTSGGGGSDVVTFQPTGITIAGVTTLPKATGSTSTYLRADGSWATIGTSNVTEDTNLFYTNARVYAAVTGNLALKANVVDLTTANVTETTNLYFTNARVRTALTSANGISYSNSTGLFGLTTTGVSASTYGGSSNVPVITIDSFGRISSAANVAVAGVSAFSASGNAFTITTSAGTTFIANIQQDSVRLGTDTTGAYLANLIQGTGISLSGLGNEGATPTIALGTSGVTAGTYGNSSVHPSFTVDAYGRITSASNVAIATTLSIAGGTGTDTVNLLSDTLTFAGTTNEIETIVTNNQVQIGLPDNVTIGNNLSVGGNLTVNGVVTTLNTAVSVVEDPLLKLGNGNPADTLDLGFFGVYTSGTSKFAGLFRDASDSGKFKLFTGLDSDPDSVPDVVNTAGSGYTRGTLVADITGGNVSGLLNAIAVADGGTGKTSLTVNSIMYPNTSSSFGFATGSSGHILQLNTSGVPVFGTLDGGTY